MSIANLRAALGGNELSRSRSLVLDGNDLEHLIREGQNRFKRPHLRDYGYGLPIPFRWGPQGSLILLGMMILPIALAAVILSLL